MKQISPSRYIVEEKEEVTVEIVAIQTANTASFVVDTACQLISENPIVYRFQVTKKSGQTHFGEARGAFHGPPPSEANADPRFEIFLTGSFGGNKFTGPVIRRSDPDHMSDLTFEIPEQP